MRYEVKPILTESFGETILATDDAGEAKIAAEKAAYDHYYGTAIIDNELRTVDCGDRVVPLEDFFELQTACEHDWHYYGAVNGQPHYACQSCGEKRN